MALKENWVDKIDGVDPVSAAHINQVAHAVIDLENDLESGAGGSVTEEQIAEAVENYFEEHPVEGGGAFIITATAIGGELTNVSRTFEEIYAAYEDGQQICLQIHTSSGSTVILQCTNIDSDNAFFDATTTTMGENFIHSARIFSDNTSTYTTNDIAGAEGELTAISITNALGYFPADNAALENLQTLHDDLVMEVSEFSGTYARKEEIPTSASDVKADPSGTADSKVSSHNTSNASHNDIRLLIEGLTTRLNALADSDDTTLDQLSEIVAYIKANKSLIDSITTSKVNVADIIDNLTTSASNKPLSAKMGVQLKALIDAITIPTTLPASDVYAWAKAATKPTYTKAEVELGNVDNVKQYSASNPPPYPVTKVNDKTGAVSLSASDVGADASGTASSAVSTHNSSASAHSDIREEISQLSEEIDDLKQNGSVIDQFDDTVLVQNAYDAETAKFNVRLAGNAGTEATYNGSLALDYIKVKYDPDAYVLISGIEKLVLNWDYYFAVNYYDANKNPVGCIIMAASHFGTYDGTLPCSFPIFRPTVNSESEIVGIENTEYVRIKLGIATKATAISATDCEGLSVKIATKADISKQSSAIPSHWETTVAEKTETIKALQTNGGKNCVSFAWASDTHIPNNAAGRTDYLGKVMARMLDNCETPFAVITGDAVTRGSLPTEEEYLAEQAQVSLHLAPLWGTDRLLVALGNHDGCWGDSTGYYRHQLPPERMWQTFFRWQALDFRRVFSDDGSYFYVDNVAQKTRFIVLNSHFGGEYAEDENGFAVNNRFKTSCYGQEQLDWLADVALDMESGYGAVIFTHVPPRAVNGATAPYTVDYAQFNGIINAYCNKTTYSGSFAGVDGWTSNNVSVDFTNAQGEIIALFAGHIHEDTIDTETLECPIITVTAGGAPSNNDEQIYNRPFGTSLETSFDVVTINRATKMIYCTRIGAGSDRSISYGGAEIVTYTVTWVVDGNTTTETYNDGDTPSFKGSTDKASDGQYTYTFTGWSPSIAPVTGNVTYTAQYSKTEIVPDVETYTITNTLTNCSNSNSATTIEEGSAYSATITAIDGYALDSVSVTMGGSAVSVTDGNISIASVTGDIVITAVASKTSTEPSYTNLAVPNDTNTTWSGAWVNNARMGSDAKYRSSTNSMVTNCIPINRGDTIYFANTGMTSAGNGVTSGVPIAFYDDIEATTKWIAGTPDALTTYSITFAYNDDGTLKSMAFNEGESAATYYFRLCLANTVDKYSVIITKNEPIV